MAAFIELLEQPDPHVRPRRLYINVESIAYVSAYSESSPAIITFREHTTAPIAVSETWEHVQALIDHALTGKSSPVEPPPMQGGSGIDPYNALLEQ